MCCIFLGIIATTTAAQTLLHNTPISGTISAPASYDFTTEEQGLLTITIDPVTAENYLTIELYDKVSGERLEYVYMHKSQVVATFGLLAGRYELKVLPNGGGTQTPFKFTTSFEKGDTYDWEQNTTPEQAVKIPTNTNIKGNYSNWSHSDYYKFSLTKAQQLTLKPTQYAHYKLLDANLTLLGSTELEQLQIELPAGDYYFDIKGSNYSFSYNYKDITMRTELEPNNKIENATLLEQGQVVYARGTYFNDEDMFSFSMPETGLATFTLQQPTDNHVTFKVLDASGTELYEFRDKHAFTMGLKRGDYYLVVKPIYNPSEPYSISYSVEGHDNPNVEPNNLDRNAQFLALNTELRAISPGNLGTLNTFVIDVSDNGYYSFNVDADQENVMSMSLTDASGTHVGTLYGDTYKTIRYPIGLGKGRYYIQMWSSDKVPYSIRYTKLADHAEHESNQFKKNATALKLNTLTYGRIDTRGDEDFYMFTLTEEQHVSWVVEKLNGEVLWAKLMNATNKVVWEQSSFVNTFVTKKLPKGTYYLKLTGTNQPSEYTLKVNTNFAAFKDVPTTHRYYNEIMAVRSLGIINGYQDDTFRPTAPMQRQHVAAMLARAEAPAIPISISYYDFPDVLPTHANYVNINKLVSAGIVNENPKGFNPTGTITRAQMAKMLVIAYDLEPTSANTPTFKDVAKGAWYEQYVKILVQHGITTGDKGNFKPNEPLTRQHFTVFMSRVLAK